MRWMKKALVCHTLHPRETREPNLGLFLMQNDVKTPHKRVDQLWKQGWMDG